MASNIALRVKIYIESIGSELFRRLYVPDSFSIGELIQSINTRLLSERIEGEIYFMFNEYQVDMVEESRLGGILFPEDILLVRSMIENNSLLYVNGRIIVPPVAANAANAAAEEASVIPNGPQAVPPPLEEYSDEEDGEENDEQDYEDQAIQNISQQLLALMQGGVQGQNVLELNIHSNAAALELNSFLDVFSNIANLQPMPVAVAPPIAGAGVINNTIMTANLFSDLLTILQNPGGVAGNYQDVVVGLDKNDLDKQKVDTYINFGDSTRDSCSVCIDKFIPDDICRELKCNHLFHKDCIDHWLSDNISCPVCRTECGKGVPKL
jgi:hypothetical protein